MSESGSCDVTAPDVSGYSYPGTPKEVATWEVLLKCVVMGILILVGIVGNSLVIIIVSVSKKMRTTINFYIVNLAIADLFVACFPTWIYVTTNVTDGWILGEFICKFNASVQVSAMSAISFTMIAIAGDRFFAIIFPLRARVTQRKAKVVVFIIWTCAISIGIPPFVFYKYTERRWKDYLETFCTDVWPVLETKNGCDLGATSQRLYWTVVVAALNWIPMLVMTIIYTTIIHRLHFSRMIQTGNNNHSLVQQKSTRKVIKMLFSLLIAFMVCTIPFQVSTLYENFKDRQKTLPGWYQPVYYSAITLMYAHSSINPIMYGAMNHSFRQGFRVLVNRIRGKPLQQSTWDSRITALDSIQPPGHIRTVNNGRLKTDGSVRNLVGTSTYLNKAVLVEE